jgi:hypothetical protein
VAKLSVMLAVPTMPEPVTVCGVPIWTPLL